MVATFNAIATAPVSETTDHDRVSGEKGSQILKGGVDELKRQVRVLVEYRPSVIAVTFGGGQYTLGALLERVEALRRSRNFKLVVILHHDGRFPAYMPTWAVSNPLSTPSMRGDFVRVLNEGRQELFSYPGVARKTISTNPINAENLREMMARNRHSPSWCWTWASRWGSLIGTN